MNQANFILTDATAVSRVVEHNVAEVIAVHLTDERLQDHHHPEEGMIFHVYNVESKRSELCFYAFRVIERILQFSEWSIIWVANNQC